MRFTRAKLLVTLISAALSGPTAAAIVLGTAGATASAALDEGAANASISLAVPFDDLVHDSRAASLVTPVEAHAVWEDGRICTYTRVHVDRAVAGGLGVGQEVWVRTLGGIVGKVGQSVEGEPVFVTGKPSLLFVHDGPAGTLEVTARAQGQFAVVTADDARTLKVIRNRNAGPLVASLRPFREWTPQSLTPTLSSTSVQSGRVRFAADVLHDRALDDAVRDVALTWERIHGK